MAKFNVTCIRPEGFLHSSGFNEVIDSLSWSLASLGHDVNVTQNWISEQRETNIIFGAELAADFQRFPPGSILFNLEQTSHPNMAKVRKLAKDSRCIVWDYSSRAVEEWKSFGHEQVVHCPIGYTPNLTRIPHADPIWDVLFVGWMTPRRIALIDELKKHGLNVYSSAACYGGGRDYLIGASKVILNAHHDGRDRFEIVRCSYLMANAKCVITESSSDDDEYADLASGLVRSPYRMLVESCRSYCSTDSERQWMEGKAFDLIRKRDFPSAVSAALDSIPPVITPTPSRPIQFKQERAKLCRDFFAEARQIRIPDETSTPSRVRDPRVAARFASASEIGDMKDFVAWLRAHAHGNILEIGVRDGASTSALLSGIEDTYGHLYSVDIDSCGHLFKGHPDWTFIQADSKDFQTVIKQIPYQLDVILVDGDHSEKGVISDVEYARQLRPGGLVIFHDTEPEERPSGCDDMSWPGDAVKRVYSSLCHNMSKEGWTHEELPGRYGMGVLRRPKEDVSEGSVSVRR